jgi:ATP-dependent helicase IRC3
MASSLKLRPYQEDCIRAVLLSWGRSIRRPAVVLPTGSGKTVIFSHLVERFRQRGDGKRVVILVHRDELADQAINKIRQIAPDLSVGKVKAEYNEVEADVVVCSVQTVSRDRRLAQLEDGGLKPVGLIITDECHHGSAVSYQKIYDAFPDALNVGFTATLARGDGRSLGDVWDEVVYSRSVLNMIGNGYLVDPKAKRVDIQGLDLAGVKKSRGDYQAADLGLALEETDALDQIARAYQEHAKDRPGIVFTPTVATAYAAKESFENQGIETEVITGETPREDRVKIFDQYRKGLVQVLANCMVLTEGFDAPWASCAVIARPTQSQPLYVQMVGRVLRPFPGKTDALVLDVTGSGGMRLKTLIDLEPGVVKSVEDGESLAEAVVREDEEAKEAAPPGSVFKRTVDGLTLTVQDLFAASDKHWLRTDGGVLFISAGPGEVFLWPSASHGDGFWDVCFSPKTGKWQRKRQGLSLEMAMAWGEAEAEDYAEFSVKTSASWRTGRPSPAQVGLATTLKIQGAEGMRKGELSDRISVKLASRKFDRHMK